MLLKTEFSHALSSLHRHEGHSQEENRFFFLSQRKAADPAAVCTWPLQEIKPPVAKSFINSYVTFDLL